MNRITTLRRAFGALVGLLLLPIFIPAMPQIVQAALTGSVEFDDNIQRVSDDRRSVNASVAVDVNGKTHVAYLQQAASGSEGIVLYVNNISGSFSAPRQIDGARNDAGPRIAFVGDALVFFYTDRNGDARYRRGTFVNATMTLGNSAVVDSDGNKSYVFGVVGDASGNTHFSWISNKCPGTAQYNVYYRKLESNQTFDPIEAPRQECDTYQNAPRLAVSDTGQVYMAFQRAARGDIYFARRDRANAWTTKNVSNSGSMNSLNPDIAADGTGGIFITWGEGIASGNHDILFVRSTDNGQNFSSIAQISNGPEYAQYPTIAYSKGAKRAYIAWQDNLGSTSTADIFFREFDPAGRGEFGVADRVVRNSGNSQEPSIATASNQLAIVWHNRADNGNFEIQRNGGRVAGAVGQCAVASLTLANGAAQIGVTNFTGAVAITAGCTPTQYQIAYNNRDENAPRLTWPGGTSATLNFLIPPSDVSLCTQKVNVRLIQGTTLGPWTEASIKVDTQVNARVTATNPNIFGVGLTFSPLAAEGQTRADTLGSGASDGDPLFTRSNQYRLTIEDAGECSALASFTANGGATTAIVGGKFVGNMPFPIAQPPIGPNTVNISVKDAAGNIAPDVQQTLTYDPADLEGNPGGGRPVWNAGMMSTDDASATARQRLMRTLTLTRMRVTDNLYRPNTTTQYWGVWVATEFIDATTQPADPNRPTLSWNPYRVADPAAAEATVRINLFRGLPAAQFGPRRDRPGTYRVYVRVLDGAGNYAVNTTTGANSISSGTLTTTLTLDPGYYTNAPVLPLIFR